MKYTQRNGKILIKIQYLYKQIKKDTDFLLISVTDNGEGIKRESKKNIFKLFGPDSKKHDNKEVKGIGLGLTISKLIVHKFDGHIDYISKPEKGSTFFYTFRVDPYSQYEANVHIDSICEKIDSSLRNEQPMMAITIAKIPILRDS